MGEDIALNWRAGFPLTVRNVRPEPIARLEAAGTTAVRTNFEAGSRSDLVCIARSMRNKYATLVYCTAPTLDSSRGCAPEIVAIHGMVSAGLSRELARHSEAKGVQCSMRP